MTTLKKKNAYMRSFEAAVTTGRMDIYARAPKRWKVFQSIWSNQTFTHREKIGYLFVLKFDHEQRPGFMSIFRYKNQPQNKYILF